MYYVVHSKKNPMKPDDEPLFYCVRRTIGIKTLTDVAHHIEKRTSLTVGDILNVLESSVDLIAEFSKDGYTVSMGNLGIFRGTFKSRGVEDPNDADAKLIHSARITFVASPQLKLLLTDTHFKPYPDI